MSEMLKGPWDDEREHIVGDGVVTFTAQKWRRVAYRIEEQVISSIKIKACRDGKWEVLDVRTHPDYRGEGYSRKLVQAACRLFGPLKNRAFSTPDERYWLSRCLDQRSWR